MKFDVDAFVADVKRARMEADSQMAVHEVLTRAEACDVHVPRVSAGQAVRGGAPQAAPPHARPRVKPCADSGVSTAAQSQIFVDFEDRWLDRAARAMLSPEEEARIRLLASSVEGRLACEDGVRLETVRRSLALLKPLYRYYFRVESTGHEAIPEKEPGIVVGNHGGLLPFDGARAIVDLFLRLVTAALGIPQSRFRCFRGRRSAQHGHNCLCETAGIAFESAAASRINC